MIANDTQKSFRSSRLEPIAAWSRRALTGFAHTALLRVDQLHCVPQCVPHCGLHCVDGPFFRKLLIYFCLDTIRWIGHKKSNSVRFYQLDGHYVRILCIKLTTSNYTIMVPRKISPILAMHTVAAVLVVARRV